MSWKRSQKRGITQNHAPRDGIQSRVRVRLHAARGREVVGLCRQHRFGGEVDQDGGRMGMAGYQAQDDQPEDNWHFPKWHKFLRYSILILLLERWRHPRWRRVDWKRDEDSRLIGSRTLG